MQNKVVIITGASSGMVKRLFMNLQNVVRKLPWVPGIWMNYTKSKQI